MIHRTFRYRLKPTAAQETAFRQHAGVVRLVYNLGLEQRRDWWRQFKRCEGKSISFFSQSLDLTALRAEFDWIAAVTQTCEQQALRDLDRAFANFFAGRARFPSPRRKGINESFRFLGREVEIRPRNKRWLEVRLPKIGWVRFRDTRPIRGKTKNVTVALDALGWHVCFSCEVDHEAPINANPAVGIDRGVANTLALSTGEMMSLPASLDRIERQKRRAQKALSRKKRGSNRRAKAVKRVARLAARAARIRKDWHHRRSLDIARRFGTVVVEDMKILNMTASARGTVEEPGRNVRQKAGLNRAILSQGWGQFVGLLSYKLEERGGTLVSVNPAFTSQTCSACGAVDSRSRESQSAFVCRCCGFSAHADENAAINILRRSTASMRVEEVHEHSCET